MKRRQTSFQKAETTKYSNSMIKNAVIFFSRADSSVRMIKVHVSLHRREKKAIDFELLSIVSVSSLTYRRMSIE